jgi:UPF0042 nucleotide-binding protein
MMTEGGHAEPCPAGNAAPARVLLVTGMPGAGRSTVLKTLEDMGYEAFDNLPLSLVPALIESIAAGARAIASAPTCAPGALRSRGCSNPSTRSLAGPAASSRCYLSIVMTSACNGAIPRPAGPTPSPATGP